MAGEQATRKTPGARAAGEVLLRWHRAPFPFTAVIGAASALQYPGRKLFSIAFAARLVRFSIVSALAVEFGRQILAIVKSSAFFWTMIVFIGLCLIASAYSVIGWIRRSGT